MTSPIISTRRLSLYCPTGQAAEVELLYQLWTNPQVMKYVGFPTGLKITRQEIRDQMIQMEEGVMDRYLIVQVKTSQEIIGEAKLGSPNPEGISETDVKIQPQYWGQGFGKEIKRGLVDYLFTNSDCRGVKATPHQSNQASIEMQKAVGAEKVGEGIFEFPPSMADYTCPVPHYIYILYREKWEQTKKKSVPDVIGNG